MGRCARASTDNRAEFPPKFTLPSTHTHLSFLRGHLLLVLAPLVLEPDPDHPGREPGHLHQLLLEQRVRPRVGRVAALEEVQLLLSQHSPHPAGPVAAPLLLAVLKILAIFGLSRLLMRWLWLRWRSPVLRLRLLLAAVGILL